MACDNGINRALFVEHQLLDVGLFVEIGRNSEQLKRQRGENELNARGGKSQMEMTQFIHGIMNVSRQNGP